MVNNTRYSIVVIFRVILITLNCFALIWLFTQTTRPATTLFVFILLLFQTGSLIFYHNRINRDLANFLIFLQDNDMTLAFSKKRIERSFKGLTFQLDKINQKLQAARIDRERQFQYLQSVVKQVDTGIIAYDQEGKVELFNRAARELLGIPSLNRIDRLAQWYPELEGIITSGYKTNSSPIRIKVNGIHRILAVKSGSIGFDNRVVQLISFQDIRSELEARELEAWRKLIRIQRHEIINSITPITTLTTAIRRRFLNGKQRRNLQEITDEHIDDVLSSVEVIEERSLGLIDFVERFKSLTDVPKIKIVSFMLKKLVNHIDILFARELNARKIQMTLNLSPANLSLQADEKLFEQVLINLVKNSLEAIHHQGGKIVIKAYRNTQNSCIVQVIDDGIGIDKTAIDSIFIPSYTTKENGSGIGLSISQQIIQLHKGIISVKSEPGVETVFEILLPEQFS